MTPTSGEADGIRLIRSISLVARALTSSGMPGGLDLLAELVDLGLLRVVLAELALDRLELLAEDVLALGLVHLGLDLALDLPLELEDLDLSGEERGDELQALDDVHRLEQLLALRGVHVGAVRDHVGEQARLGDVACGDGGLGRDRGAVRDVLLHLRLDGAHERLDLDAGRRRLLEVLHLGAEVRVGGLEAEEPDPALPLDDGTDRAVLELDDLGDLREGADLVELGGVDDVLALRLALRDERDHAVRGDGRVERVDALLAAHLERHDHLREDDGLTERDERQHARAARGGLLRRCLRLVGLGRCLRHSILLCGRAGSGARTPLAGRLSSSQGVLRAGAPVRLRRVRARGTRCRAPRGSASPISLRARRGRGRRRGSRLGPG